jgi:hypothetical protein
VRVGHHVAVSPDAVPRVLARVVEIDAGCLASSRSRGKEWVSVEAAACVHSSTIATVTNTT